MMKKAPRTNTISPAVLFALALLLGPLWGAERPALADPVVLFAAPTAGGSADCSSWENACDLQTALAAAHSDDQIWVKMGLHKPDAAGNRSASFALRPGVALYGGFAGDEVALAERDWHTHLTVLSGDIDNNDQTDPGGVVTLSTHIAGDNSYHVVSATGGLDQTARLDGFIITAGQANGSAPNSQGGGMQAIDSSPTLANLVFSGNYAGEGGGLHTVRSHPSLTDVIFSGNRGCYTGCGMETVDSDPRLDRVIFRNNQADHGGAMITGASSPILTNVIFSGNTAVESGGAINNSTGSNLIILNATFNSNYSGRYGGAIFSYMSNLTLINAILWGNADLFSYEIAGMHSTADINYSDIRYPVIYPGMGNLNLDPLFVDANGPDDIAGNADDDLRLLPGSPAIDAGSNSAVPAGVAVDLNGGPRVVDEPTTPDTGSGTPPLVDMGAHEAAFAAVTLEKTVSASEFQPGDSIVFSLTLANHGAAGATQVELTDTLPDTLADRSVTSSDLAFTIRSPSPDYVLEVQDLAPGQSGTITIQGVLSAPLAAGSFLNTAVVEFDAGYGRPSVADNAGYSVSNLAPAITSTPILTAVQGWLFSYSMTTSDSNGDLVTLTAPVLPAWLTLTDHGNGTATLSGTPAPEDVGKHDITLQAADPDGLTVVQSFTLGVESRLYLPLAMRSEP